MMDSYDAYSPYTKPSGKRSGGGAGGAPWLAWVVVALLCCTLGGFGWQLHSVRTHMAQLQVHTEIIEQSLIQEKVRARPARSVAPPIRLPRGPGWCRQSVAAAKHHGRWKLCRGCCRMHRPTPSLLPPSPPSCSPKQ